jgi:V-type H+-transporting ATPase proteolipid subunit
MKSLVPIVMASIVGIYGLVVAVLIVGNMNPEANYSLFQSFCHLGSGLGIEFLLIRATGFAGLAAGYAIGVVGDVSVRSYAFQPKCFVAMVLILIFAEVLGLYGFIVSLILVTKTASIPSC